MKKTILLLIVGTSFVFSTKAQELTCEDFKTGEFIIPQAEELREYTIKSKDSTWTVSPKKDPTINRYIVIREKNTQVEWRNGIGVGNPMYEIIEWLDDCTYRLTFDASKAELDEDKQWVNDNNGIVVSKTRIEGNCLFYTSTMTTNNGQIISQDGVICKE